MVTETIPKITKDDILATLPEEFTEYLKIKFSFLYFLKYGKILDATKNKTVDFQFWPHLVDVAHAICKNRLVIILKARQIGISVLLAFYALWKMCTVHGFKVAIISAGQRSGQSLLAHMKFAYNNLPDFIKPKLGSWSHEGFSFIDKDGNETAKVVVFPSTENPTIGDTFSLVISDEADFHKYPKQDYASTEPTVSAGGQHIVISTRNKEVADSDFVNMYKDAKNNLNGYISIFLNALSRPGRTKEWLELEKKLYIGKEYLYDGNYPMAEEQALSVVSGASFFRAESLNDLLAGTIQPLKHDISYVFPINRYTPGFVYAAGVDVSQGVGGDESALCLLRKRGEVVEDSLWIHANMLTPDIFADICNSELAAYKKPLLAGEANSIGTALLTEFKYLKYPHIFTREEPAKNVVFEGNTAVSKEDKVRKMGWWTGYHNRNRMLSELATAIANRNLIIRYKPAILQLTEFHRIMSRSNELQIRSAGKHDDLVLALAIAYQMIKLKPANTTLSINLPFSMIENVKMAGAFS